MFAPCPHDQGCPKNVEKAKLVICMITVLKFWFFSIQLTPFYLFFVSTSIISLDLFPINIFNKLNILCSRDVCSFSTQWNVLRADGRKQMFNTETGSFTYIIMAKGAKPHHISESRLLTVCLSQIKAENHSSCSDKFF